MHDQLTEQDLREMQEELDWRRRELTPKLLEEVKTARAFGDLSENFEYKAAKQDQNKNRSRIRYLERMIATARVLRDRSAEDEVGLFDRITVWFEEDELEEVYQIVSTVKVDPSEESRQVSPMSRPVGTLARSAGTSSGSVMGVSFRER